MFFLFFFFCGKKLITGNPNKAMKIANIALCCAAISAGADAFAPFNAASGSKSALRFFGGGSGAKDLDEEVRAPGEYNIYHFHLRVNIDTVPSSWVPNILHFPTIVGAPAGVAEIASGTCRGEGEVLPIGMFFALVWCIQLRRD